MKIQIFALIDKEATKVTNSSVWCLCADEASMAEAKVAYANPVYETDTTAKWVTCDVPVTDLVAGLLGMLHDSSFEISYPILTVL